MAAVQVRSFVDFSDVLHEIGATQTKTGPLTQQLQYLKNYLSRLQAKTIVVEKDYTDGGYLADYANYYAFCHEQYERRTHRLHFFQAEYQAAEFENLIFDQNDVSSNGKKTAAELARETKYLGFSVIKPLPATIVGRTCLVPYTESENSDGHVRAYPIKRAYPVSLYGLPLEVNSVAFQEQDNEVAACATTAIWFALHASPRRITESLIPSPYDITHRASTNVAFTQGVVTYGNPHRRFPTVGLQLPQIVEYLRRRGYDCISYGVRQEGDKIPGGEAHLTNEIVMAYLRAKTPIILVGNLHSAKKKTAKKDKENEGEVVNCGMHAVVVLGCAINPLPKRASRYLSVGGHWKFERIENLYVHDDGLGPFAKYQWRIVTGGDLPIKYSTDPSRSIQAYLINEPKADEDGPVRYLDPGYVVVPIRDKVRLNHSDIREFVDRICAEIYSQTTHGMTNDEFERLRIGEWALELIEVNELKKYIATTDTLKGERHGWLTKPLPKYMWRLTYAICRHEVPTEEKNCAFFVDWEVLFDATDLSQSAGLLGCLVHSGHPNSNDPLNRQMARLFFTHIRRGSSNPEILGNPAFPQWKAMLEEIASSC